MVELIGLLAGAMTTGACIPQAYKVIKTKNTRDLSFPTYTLLVFGCALWAVYGLLIGSMALVATNSFSFILLGIIWFIMFKEKYIAHERREIKKRLQNDISS